MTVSVPSYLGLLKERVLVFDGAMGTSIQARSPTPSDFGGEALEGCNDHLVLSRPDLVREIHASFLEVGCDVLETNTFRSNRLAIEEYGLQDQVPDLNRLGAALARGVADAYSTAGRPRFVAGSIGPSGFLPSSSDPELGKVTYETLVEVYREQATGLLQGGVDLLLIETGQDILEVKAAVTGARLAMQETSRQVPLQAQVTLDTTGRMLLGTDAASAQVTLEALKVDVLGLNCSTGPEHMREPLELLARRARTPLSVIPNAGIPVNRGGIAEYPLTPEELARAHRSFVDELGVGVIGGCCGTTPEHLQAVVEATWGRRPGSRSTSRFDGTGPRVSSGVRAVELAQLPAPTLVGERVNAQGSRAVKRLLLADDLDGVLQVARDQVEAGAHLLDVSVALTERGDEAGTMRTLVKLLSQGVEAPLMIDTTEVDVAVAALRQIPGRAVINSIHLEGGREKVDLLLPHVVEHGAALLALTIDEEGMAKTAARKVEVANRIARICLEEYGLSPDALIFDPLTFTLATGDPEFRSAGVETLEGIRRIKEGIPGTLTSLGISNISFGLQPQARRVVNSVFLHHAVEAGLDMAIVNPAHVTPFGEIDPEERRLAEDLVFDRTEDALPRLIAHFEGREAPTDATVDPREGMGPGEALGWSIVHRRKDGVEELVEATVRAAGGDHPAAVEVLNRVLLPAMKEVGDRFGAGDLILPFVLQSAEVMKRAVTRLEDFLDQVEGETKGTVVLATVFGDVHDIGKNLVHTILENNGYTVHNLGKQVPVNTIIQKAQELNADAIGLSALLVSTSKQMPLCVQELDRRRLPIPVLLGGAAITPSFARRAARVGGEEEGGGLYGAGVFYCKDAFDGLNVMEALREPNARRTFLERGREELEEKEARREELVERASGTRVSLRPPPSPAGRVPDPPFWGRKVLASLPLEEIYPLVDRNTLYRLHWGAKNAKGEAFDRLVREEFEPRFRGYASEAEGGGSVVVKAAYGYFPAASSGDDLILFDPESPAKEAGRFPFPRQAGRERLCLSDFFRPAAENGSPAARDVAVLQVVTVMGPLLEKAEEMMVEGDYSEGYFLHGFGVRLAEAGAELLHRRIRKELGIGPEEGLRYSWGYPACPDTHQHEILFRLLPARERLGMDLTEAGALVPELSTAALVVHHPDARYFSV
jgi:5-methyltetrahydrofolate--homocysteine methyltransferase